MYSTSYLRFLILFIILGQPLLAIAQDSTRYRVEVLVLRHLEGFPEPLPMTELPDLSGLIDPALPTDPPKGQSLPPDPFYLGPPDSELLPPLGPFPEPEDTEGVVVLAERSERMDAVWRNLRLSAEFRPEAFLAWEQPYEAPFPEFRVHNAEVIWIEDPWGDTRTAQPGYFFHYDLQMGSLGMTPIPEPVQHYALDGRVQLRRTRFLHLEIDLAHRAVSPGAVPGMAGPPLRADLGVFQVYPLRQTRQVRTGRMEYFDSPMLGVLLWVTEIKSSEGLAE